MIMTVKEFVQNRKYIRANYKFKNSFKKYNNIENNQAFIVLYRNCSKTKKVLSFNLKDLRLDTHYKKMMN